MTRHWAATGALLIGLGFGALAGANGIASAEETAIAPNGTGQEPADTPSAPGQESLDPGVAAQKAKEIADRLEMIRSGGYSSSGSGHEPAHTTSAPAPTQNSAVEDEIMQSQLASIREIQQRLQQIQTAQEETNRQIVAGS